MPEGDCRHQRAIPSSLNGLVTAGLAESEAEWYLQHVSSILSPLYLPGKTGGSPY
jgi:hypothetical protein